MATVALYRATYHGPTDTRGSRFTVRDMATGARRVIPFDHSAPNAAAAAVSRVTGVNVSAVEYVGEDNRNKYYAVPLAAVDELREEWAALTSSVVGGGE